MDVTLPICSRLHWRFDLAPLLAAMERIDPTAWVALFNIAYYQGDWSGIDLVAAVDAPIPLAPGFGPVARSALCAADPAWPAAIERFGEGLRSARLLRLGAGASIREHCDPDLGAPEGPLRLHVPLLSPPGVEFLVDGRQVPMAPGECWFIDLSRPHRVDNPGPGPRIHLVLDCMMDTRLREALADGLPTTPALQPSRGVRAFAAFNEQVQQRPELAQALQRITDPTDFCREAVAAGQSLGLMFGEADVRMAMRQGRQAWSRQWSVR
ncbi:aspartyl/asparaginyl beta-hydroxylase domain-containing protein [Pseudomonas tohonis]|uniref:aspartyl/asparaginyl beta-hydroxylase domain-containing protein n=1 Tax=Pseudomonas tohonis TaxID=2725477 RepID=UPI001F2E1DF2|nr:aspartyl/asparaginyl beta-hydroxylase domain-containing protein [Pseudomonas tohonis]